MSPIVALFFVIATAEISSAQPAVNVSPSSLPYYHVLIEKEGIQKCSGSIIATEYILTAGHCVINVPVEKLKVRVVSTFPQKVGDVYVVQSIKVHENFTTNGTFGFSTNDIALLKLSSPIIINDLFQPIELYDSTDRVIEGENATISGWTSVAETDESPSKSQSAVVQIVSKTKCNEAFKNMIGGIPKGMICANWPKKEDSAVCFGDEGGALVIDSKQAGIISWSFGCTLPQFPGLYVDVSHYSEWLNDNIEL